MVKCFPSTLLPQTFPVHLSRTQIWHCKHPSTNSLPIFDGPNKLVCRNDALRPVCYNDAFRHVCHNDAFRQPNLCLKQVNRQSMRWIRYEKIWPYKFTIRKKLKFWNKIKIFDFCTDLMKFILNIKLECLVKLLVCYNTLVALLWIWT